MQRLFALIPLAVLAALWAGSTALLRKADDGENARWRDMRLWRIIVTVFLVLEALWCALGLYEGDAISLATCSVAVLAIGAVGAAQASRPHTLDDHMARLGWPPVVADVIREVCNVLALLIATGLAMLALELPWNGLNVFSIPWRFVRLELVAVALVILFCYFVGQRRRAGACAGVALVTLVGVAQYFVLRFKGEAILPSDFLALGTASAVIGSYSYVIDADVLRGLTCALAAMCAISFMRKPRKLRFERRLTNVVANLTAAVAMAVGLVGWLVVPSYANDFGVYIHYWSAIEYYRQQGFFPSFAYAYQDLPIEKPAGYSNSSVQEATDTLVAAYESDEGSMAIYAEASAQFDELKPTVIAIMNESFSDLSVYDGLGVGYEGPTYFNGVDDALLRGDLYVSAFSGGTCNSEFEFLTGNSLAYIGYGQYPYQVYNFRKIETLPRQFARLGYSTCAIHPNLGENWNRTNVYKQMGFDTFLTINDFAPDTPTFHSGITDAATYDRILQLLEEDSSPQFIFDVTMQNHSGYNQNNIPEDRLTTYEIEGLSDEDEAAVNEYLSCIEAADADLEEFMAALSELDRPVILIFFGDHQPSVSPALNEAFFSDEGSVEYTEREWHTSYLIWANYDVAGSAQASVNDTTSVNYLGAMALQAVGAPLTTYQQAQLGARKTMPALNLIAFMDPRETWYDYNDPAADLTTYTLLDTVFYKNFAEKVGL